MNRAAAVAVLASLVMTGCSGPRDQDCAPVGWASQVYDGEAIRFRLTNCGTSTVGPLTGACEPSGIVVAIVLADGSRAFIGGGGDAVPESELICPNPLGGQEVILPGESRDYERQWNGTLRSDRCPETWCAIPAGSYVIRVEYGPLAGETTIAVR